MQALILALRHVTDQICRQAADRGGHLEWLGNQERIVFAREALSDAAEAAILSLLGGMKRMSKTLDAGSSDAASARKQAVAALRNLAQSVDITPTRRKTTK